MSEVSEGTLEFLAEEVKKAMDKAKKNLVLPGPCPTVRVRDDKAPGGFVVINENDVTDVHELWENPAAEPKPAEPGPNDLYAKHIGGGRWHVMKGTKKVAGPMLKSAAKQYVAENQ